MAFLPLLQIKIEASRGKLPQPFATRPTVFPFFLLQRRGVNFLGLIPPSTALDPSTGPPWGPSLFLFPLFFFYNSVSIVLSIIQIKLKHVHVSAILKKRLCTSFHNCLLSHLPSFSQQISMETTVLWVVHSFCLHFVTSYLLLSPLITGFYHQFTNITDDKWLPFW